MVLRLDPRIPVVWRNPTSMQFGISTPVAVLRDVSVATERMVAALTAGITRPGLAMIGGTAGATSAEVDSLLASLGPALGAEGTPPPARTIVVTGEGTLASRIAELLGRAGLEVRVAAQSGDAAGQECEFAVAVGHFVLEPELHGLWLRRDVPHLPVVLGDRAVTVGPIVEPGLGPCLYCLARYATDADEAWPAIATQLLGRRSSADTELLSSEVGALVARIVVARLAATGPELSAPARSAAAHTQHRIDVDNGERSTRDFDVHPGCGCLQPGLFNRPGGVNGGATG